MITDLKNRDILSKLANNSNVLEFLLKLRPDEIESFLTIIRWSPSLLVKLRDQPEHMRVLHRMWPIVPDRDEFIKSYFDIYYHETAGELSILDAFSQGQIDSKIWLIDALIKLDRNLGRVWIMCGWIGLLAYLIFKKQARLKLESICSFDIDPVCADLADRLNNREVKQNWKFKASTIDVMDLTYDDCFWHTKKSDGSTERVCETADTIINTSCEHLVDFERWFFNIPDGKLIILQCSDHESYDGHVNSMNNMYELSYRAKCRRVLYKGTLDCGEYSRHMLIGVK